MWRLRGFYPALATRLVWWINVNCGLLCCAVFHKSVGSKYRKRRRGKERLPLIETGASVRSVSVRLFRRTVFISIYSLYVIPLRHRVVFWFGKIRICWPMCDWLRYQIVPRVLRNKSECNTEATVLGQHIAFPVCVAATAYIGLAHPDAEIAVAKGLKLHGWTVVTMVHSRPIQVVSLMTFNSLLTILGYFSSGYSIVILYSHHSCCRISALLKINEYKLLSYV